MQPEKNYSENTWDNCENIVFGKDNIVDTSTTNIYFITINVVSQEENKKDT